MANAQSHGRIVYVGVTAISKHLKKIFEDGELDEKVVVSILKITTQHNVIEGKIQTQKAQFYSIAAIITVGYRVNFKRAIYFWIWVTKTLKDFIIRRFVLCFERLKQEETAFGKDYFRERLNCVRFV